MDLPERIAAVRRFNRFYTRQIGVLNERLLGSELSLAQMRVLWELAHHAPLTASLLEDQLGLDAGYLSRLLRAFREHGWVRAERSERDGRSRELHLTMKGRKVFAPLDRRSEDEVRAWVAALSAARQQRLVAAMQSIEEAFKGAGETARPYVLREPRPGDFGWIVHRHGVLYAQEYGWDTTFEALVAEIVARAARARAPERERCWIAEREGERAGCVFLVKRSAR
ncbi:MAG TPA: MarR family winged helix-turn-helix transcriptional regulator, partial [Usitatibacter sp.]|nr:MarR family winged helix-turn-helix transcriptional regulator [Usitatibacter sp.]